MKVSIVILATLAMASSQDRVNFVDNEPRQNYGPGHVVDPAFYQPSNLGTGPIVDPAFYQPSNPNLGPGHIVDPAFYQPSGPSAHPGYPGYPSTLYPNPGYQPISIGPAIVENPPAPHWSQTLYPSGVARDGQN